MSVIAVNEQGVGALKQYASNLLENGGVIRQESDRLGDIVDQYQGKIGPHADQIKNALDQIKGAVNKCIEPTNSIAEKLTALANAYEKVINNNYYNGVGN